jgi:riboflavin kinase/FMN adenylyltransferase
MKIHWSTNDLPDPPLEPVLTLGNLDGVHRGHQVLLGTVVQEARRLGVPSMVVTFEPHTRKVIRPQEPFRPLMTTLEKLRRLLELGIDHVLVLPFAEGVMDMTAAEFIEEILWEPLRVRSIFVGPDAQFGKDRVGDARYLASAGRRLGFHVGVVDPIALGGTVRMSSTLAREAIAAGDLERANQILGRHHVLSGTVLRGFRVGRELGFPTANLRDEGLTLPPHGVYAGWATLENGDRHGCMLNIGVRPTFGGKKLTIEAHLFGFDGNLYGQELRVSLRERLRSEIAFGGPEALKIQLRKDAADARAVLGLKRAAGRGDEG